MTPMDVVDHIIPIKIDWSLRLSLDNLQSLCQSCHNIKGTKDRQVYRELQ
ncbi:HNH endonuclease signature motif containing protein [Domibacillus aminovorans]|nr:HNH endonuclease signature motif containing protein [Domibacillus aminovorans]